MFLARDDNYHYVLFLCITFKAQLRGISLINYTYAPCVMIHARKCLLYCFGLGTTSVLHNDIQPRCMELKKIMVNGYVLTHLWSSTDLKSFQEMEDSYPSTMDRASSLL